MWFYVGWTALKEAYLWAWIWTPWANTVGYYPLAENFNDYSWNNYNLTNSWGSITTQSWVSCAYYNWSSYSQYNGYSITSAARTINVRCYLWSTTWGMVHISKYNNSSSAGSLGLFRLSSSTAWAVDRNWAECSASVSSNARHNIVITQSSSTVKIYIDGSLGNTVSNRPNTLYTPDWWSLGSKFYSGHSEKFKGYLSRVILENKIRTATEISDYYNSTKSNYWL